MSDHYLRQHRTELEWIRNAIRACNVTAVHACAVAGPEGEPDAVLDRAQLLKEFVLNHWVD